jgi:hypothetical protein
MLIIGASVFSAQTPATPATFSSNIQSPSCLRSEEKSVWRDDVFVACYRPEPPAVIFGFAAIRVNAPPRADVAVRSAEFVTEIRAVFLTAPNRKSRDVDATTCPE